MKRTGKLSVFATVLFLTMALVISSCQKEEAAAAGNGDEKAIATSTPATTTQGRSINCDCIVNPSDTVNSTEIAMLQYMREEEKLARDVYTTMYALYPIPIFNNISKSEQHHMDQVLCLLQYYDIPDPDSTEIGVFSNPDLQTLYDTLIAQGSVALVDALTVGATIEDVDIYDLEENIAETENEAIITIFERLACASGNHMRSFSAWLTNQGVTYVPQYISQEEYDEIISTPHQFCGAQ